MTGEISPAADDHGAGVGPELRASHEDRDRVVEILRVAACDGRLTAAELDERLEAPLTARTHSELAVLTADLPAVAGRPDGVAPRAKDLVRIDYQGGNARRVGGWVVPQRMQVRAVGGTVKLDFTEAVITGPTLRIEAEVRGGSLVLVTKPGIEVDADGVAVRGGSVKVRPNAGSKRPVILRVQVSGEARGGSIVACASFRPRCRPRGGDMCAWRGDRPRWPLIRLGLQTCVAEVACHGRRGTRSWTGRLPGGCLRTSAVFRFATRR